MTTVLLGTDHAVESYRTGVEPDAHSADDLRTLAEQNGVALDDKPDKAVLAARLSGVIRKRNLDGARVVTVTFPDDMPLMEIATTITIAQGVWDSHSPGGYADSGAPTWVDSDSSALAALLAEHFGCDVGAPADVERTHWTENGPPGVGPKATSKGALRGALAPLTTTLMLPAALLIVLACTPMLRVAAGRDFQSRVMGDTASTGTGLYRAAFHIALTENTAAPADADTALTGELTGGGLARAAAAYAHTAGASNYTLTKTFTSADTVTRTIAKIGVFSGPTTTDPGTMVFETAVPSPPALVSGDQVALTETVSI